MGVCEQNEKGWAKDKAMCGQGERGQCTIAHSDVCGLLVRKSKTHEQGVVINPRLLILFT